MRQVQQTSIVSDLKSEILAANNPDQATVADRANAANLAALDMLMDTDSTPFEESRFLDDAKSLRFLSCEVREMAQVIEDLSPGSK